MVSSLTAHGTHLMSCSKFFREMTVHGDGALVAEGFSGALTDGLVPL